MKQNKTKHETKSWKLKRLRIKDEIGAIVQLPNTHAKTHIPALARAHTHAHTM